MKLRAAFLATSAFALLGTSVVHAEDYHGVHGVLAPTSALSRAEVQAEAVRAARAQDQNADVVSSRVMPPVASARTRAEVHAEAVRAAHAPDQNVSASSRVNSTVVSTLPNPVDTAMQAGSASGVKAQ